MPILAQMYCTAAISGKVTSAVHSVREAELRAGDGVGADARRVVVGRAGDQARTEHLEEALETIALAFVAPSP